MLARWLDRGLGQLLAPDERIAKEPTIPEANSTIWQFLAPDPVYQSTVQGSERVPPPAAFLSPVASVTPTRPGSDDDYVMQTPSNSYHTPPSHGEVEGRVLSGAKDTAYCETAPAEMKKNWDKVLRMCANLKPVRANLSLNRFAKALTNSYLSCE